MNKGCQICLITCLAIETSIESAEAVIPPTAVSGKEYSHFMDEDFSGVPDFEQTIFWDGLGGALDTFDFTAGAPGPIRTPSLTPPLQDPETDALANDNDLLFQQLRDNAAALIFSSDMDGTIYYEDSVGAGGTWAAPLIINALAPPRDVDAIEVWGPDSTDAMSGDDAFNYSLESRPPSGPGAFDPGLVSVWHVPGSTPGALGPVAYPLLATFELAAAIAPLAPAGTPTSLIEEELDLDGMMLDIEDFAPDPTGGGGLRVGRINFTIDPIFDASGAVVFDGGEIFTWDFAFPGPIAPAAFLFHGGHLWDTAFSVMGTFGTATENVNGIEAVPEPAAGLLLVLGMVLLCWQRRRRGCGCLASS